MTKKLLTQIKNEWRSNTWLALELLVVSVVMWFCVDYLYTKYVIYNEPRSFDISHCYLLRMGELTDKNPDFQPERSHEKAADDVRELVNRLQHRPEIEAASLSHNSYPYNLSNSTSSLQYDTLSSPGWTIRRAVTPDFVRVFRYQGTNGETPEQLAKLLEENKTIVSDNLFSGYGIPSMVPYVGKYMYLDRDTTLRVIVGASIQPPRYSDYQQARDSYSILYKLSWYSSLIELCVRVRPDQDHDFAERLRADATKQLRVGNVFIADIRSFDDIRRNFQQAQSNQLRNYVTGMSFLLLNIFLGLLGTFWFRTQQRRGEIALHKVHGATSRVVFTRLLTEGILILTLVTLPALIIDYFLTDMELNSWHNGTTFEPTRFIVCAAITYLLIALMIAVGIGIPARRAMQVQPAEALHDE